MSSQQQQPNNVDTDGNNFCKNCNDKVERKNSLVNIAQRQLHILVEDVKDELKELKSGTKKVDIAILPEEPSFKEKNVDTEPKAEDMPLVGWRRYIGIIMTITSSMLFALSVLIVKTLPEYHPFNVSAWRFFGFFLPAIPLTLYFRVARKEKIFERIYPLSAPGNKKMFLILIFRSATGAGAVAGQYYSLQWLNMADSATIIFSTPVFVSLASHFVLGEKSGFIPVLCGLITFFGVVVIARPPMLTGGDSFDTETLIGTGVALGSMILAGTTLMSIRYLRSVHFGVSILFFGFYGTCQNLVLSAAVSTFELPHSLNHWLLSIPLGLLAFGGLILVTVACKYEQASIVSLCRTFDIIFAFLWQFIFLGVVPDLYSFIGGGIVIFGVLLAAVRKFIDDLPEGHPARSKFWILLK